MGYKICLKASEDIENIWLYTFENWSLEQVDRYVNLIIDEMEYLADNPNSGKDFNPVRKNHRCSKVKSYLIFYRLTVKQRDIKITRVLHQSMDI
jgi:toxin ParE1/3/4